MFSLKAILITALSMLIICGVSTVNAATVTDLNKAYVPILAQDAQSQKAALRDALRQVMLKLSGDKRVSQHKDYTQLNNNIMQYVTSTQFVSGSNNQMLVMFNQPVLEQWIKRRGLPLWGAQRPDALLWYIEDTFDSSYRTMMVDEDDFESVTILKQASFNRGVEFTLPLMDIVDISNVSEIDVWGQFIDLLHTGAQRYNTQYTVAVKVQQLAATDWLLQYFIKSDTLLSLQQVTGESKASVIEQFVDQYADHQAQRYALDTARFVANNQLTQQILISGIPDIVAIAEIERYLNSLSIVESVNLSMQSANKSTFDVTLLGQPIQLHQMLIQGNVLQRMVDPNDEQLSLEFQYRWQ